MTQDSATLYDQGLDLFESVASRMPETGWDLPSPCAGWSALDVLGHLGTSIGMGTSLLRGEQPTWPEADRPADLVEGDPVAWFRQLAAESRAALAGADLDLEMDTPMGRRTVRDRLAFPAIDLYVHAWDVGTPSGIDVEVPAEVIDFAHSYIDPFPPEMVRGEGGAFGPEAPVPADATPTEEFIAWTGRAPRTD